MSNEDQLALTPLFQRRLVHFDLKGAPLSIGYIEKVLPLLHRWGCTHLLLEYEDTFPYSGELQMLAAPHHYSVEEIKKIQHLAAENNLDVIPLVQTFGHFEFVLKHDKFRHLREIDKYPMALCPSNEESVALVCSMLDQVMTLHPGASYMHIGCDEVFHLGVCPLCQARVSADGKEKLFFSHVRKVASHARRQSAGLTCLVWDDMFRFAELPHILACELGDLVEPMVWHYEPVFSLPSDLWDRLSHVFPRVWVASAWKGATSPRAVVTQLRYHLDNTNTWLQLLRVVGHKFKAVQGIALTGWQRFDHYAVLCELFPQGLPCLAACLRFIAHGTLTPDDIEAVKQDLKFSSPLPINPLETMDMPVCEFPGSPVYQMTVQFIRLEAAITGMLANDGLFTWANDYNIRRGFINPVHLEPLVTRGHDLLTSIQALRDQVSMTFEPVFKGDVAEEWRGVYVDPLLTRLQAWMDRATRCLTWEEKKVKESAATTQESHM